MEGEAVREALGVAEPTRRTTDSLLGEVREPFVQPIDLVGIRALIELADTLVDHVLEFVRDRAARRLPDERRAPRIAELSGGIGGEQIEQLLLVRLRTADRRSGCLIVGFGEQVSTPEEASDVCLLYTSPSPRDRQKSRMPSSA